MKTKIYQSESKSIGEIKISFISTPKHAWTIKTKNLELRSFNQDKREELLKNYTALLRNPANLKFFGDGQPWAPIEIEKFIDNGILQSAHPFCPFSVYNTETNEFMGFLCFNLFLDKFANVGSGHEQAVGIAHLLDNNFLLNDLGDNNGKELALIAKKHIKFAIHESKTLPLAFTLKEIIALANPQDEASIALWESSLKYGEIVQSLQSNNSDSRLLFFKPLLKYAVPVKQNLALSSEFNVNP